MKKLYHNCYHWCSSFLVFLPMFIIFFSDALNSGGLLSPQTSIDKLCEVLTSKFESGAHIDFYDEIKQWTPLTGRLDLIYKLWNMNCVVHHAWHSWMVVWWILTLPHQWNIFLSSKFTRSNYCRSILMFWSLKFVLSVTPGGSKRSTKGRDDQWLQILGPLYYEGSSLL